MSESTNFVVKRHDIFHKLNVFRGCDSFIAKISSFETVAKREAILNPCYWCGAYTRAALIPERRLFQLPVKH